jgi:hypothetical protein
MDMFFFDFLTNGPYDWVQGKYVREMNAAERRDWEARGHSVGEMKGNTQ